MVGRSWDRHHRCLGPGQERPSSAWSSLVSTVKAKVAALLSTVKAIQGEIMSALGNLGGMLIASGRSIISGLAQGIRDGVSTRSARPRMRPQDGTQAQLKALDPRGEHALMTRGLALGRARGGAS